MARLLAFDLLALEAARCVDWPYARRLGKLQARRALPSPPRLSSEWRLVTTAAGRRQRRDKNTRERARAVAAQNAVVGPRKQHDAAVAAVGAAAAEPFRLRLKDQFALKKAPDVLRNVLPRLTHANNGACSRRERARESERARRGVPRRHARRPSSVLSLSRVRAAIARAEGAARARWRSSVA